MYLETQLILFDMLLDAQNEGLNQVLLPLVNHAPDDNSVLWTCPYLFFGGPIFQKSFPPRSL